MVRVDIIGQKCDFSLVVFDGLCLKLFQATQGWEGSVLVCVQVLGGEAVRELLLFERAFTVVCVCVCICELFQSIQWRVDSAKSHRFGHTWLGYQWYWQRQRFERRLLISCDDCSFYHRFSCLSDGGLLRDIVLLSISEGIVWQTSVLPMYVRL